jgi:tape measure domain-containing protein
VAGPEQQIRITADISKAERAVNQLTERLSKVQKLADTSLKGLNSTRLVLDTRKAEQQLRGLRNGIAGLTRSVVVRVKEKVEREVLERTGRGRSGASDAAGLAFAAAAGAGRAMKTMEAQNQKVSASSKQVSAELEKGAAAIAQHQRAMNTATGGIEQLGRAIRAITARSLAAPTAPAAAATSRRAASSASASVDPTVSRALQVANQAAKQNDAATQSLQRYKSAREQLYNATQKQLEEEWRRTRTAIEATSSELNETISKVELVKRTFATVGKAGQTLVQQLYAFAAGFTEGFLLPLEAGRKAIEKMALESSDLGKGLELALQPVSELSRRFLKATDTTSALQGRIEKMRGALQSMPAYAQGTEKIITKLISLEQRLTDAKRAQATQYDAVNAAARRQLDGVKANLAASKRDRLAAGSGFREFSREAPASVERAQAQARLDARTGPAKEAQARIAWAQKVNAIELSLAKTLQSQRTQHNAALYRLEQRRVTAIAKQEQEAARRTAQIQQEAAKRRAGLQTGIGAGLALANIPGQSIAQAGFIGAAAGGGSAGAVAGVLTAGTVALGAFGIQATKTAINAETLQKRLEALSTGFDSYEAVAARAAAAGAKFGQSQSEAADAFGRTYARLRPMGATLDEITTIYEGFQTATKLSGTNAAEAAGAYNQLLQSLGAGALRGEELNSILEQAPALALAIANQLGTTVGKLKEFGEEGRISSALVLKALAQVREEGAGRLAKAMDTPAQKVKNLQNAFERFQVALTRNIIPAVTAALNGLATQINNIAAALDTLTGRSLGADLMRRISAGNQAANFGFTSEAADRYGAVLGTLEKPQQNRGGAVAQLQAARELSSRLRGISATSNPELNQRLVELQGRTMRTISNLERHIQEIDQRTKAAAPTAGGLASQTASADGKKVEEAVKRGVIGGITGGGQAGPSRGRSTGPHLHAQLVRGNNLESLVDQALDFGGGRTASSFGLGRGAAAHGYPGRDYYTPQGTPFTLKPGYTAQDLGIQGALGRGMRISGPGGVFELGHLQGVKTGDITGKGAAGDLLDAQQDALNNAIEFAQKQQEQLRNSQLLLENARADLNIAQERNPLQRTLLEGEKAQNEIRAKYLELQNASLSAEELLNLQLAEKAELERASNETLKTYVEQLYEALGAAQLLSKEVEKLGSKAFGGSPGGAGGADGFAPGMPNLSPGSGSGGKERLLGEYNRVQEELKALQDPITQVVAGANAIGEAFGTAFKDVASGAKSAQQALADAFQGIANHFLDAASQMIAKWIEMQIIGLAMNFFSSAATGAAASGGYKLPGGPGYAQGFSMPSLLGRASGGSVGDVQVVGERGPELFVPGQSGGITNNQNLRSLMASEGSRKEGGSAVYSPTIEATSFGGQDWVTLEQMNAAVQEGMAVAARQGADRGMVKTLDRLRQSPRTRKGLGM